MESKITLGDGQAVSKWGDTYAYIALILAITINLRRLTLSYSFVEEVIKPTNGFRDRGTPIRPYLTSSLGNISPNLRELIVLNVESERRFWAARPDEPYFDMTCFKSVEHLTLPLCGILEKYPLSSKNKLLLPPNLRTFQLRDCSFEAVFFLETFLVRDRARYSCLREVEILFDRTFKSPNRSPSGLGIAREDVQPRMLSLEKQMEAAGLKVSWVFIDSEKRTKNAPKKDRSVG